RLTRLRRATNHRRDSEKDCMYIGDKSFPRHPHEQPADAGFRPRMDQALERAKAEAKRRKRPRQRTGQYSKTDPHIAFRRRRICRLNYGVKTDVGVRPELDTEKLVGRYNDRRFGAALTNDQFTQHFVGNRTFYFWADPSTSGDEIVVMVDIDAHDGIGT